MSETKITQNQLDLGSETAVDLLAMQNGWKSRMIDALNQKDPGSVSSSDTMENLVEHFESLTGNTPDTIYRVFRGVTDDDSGTFGIVTVQSSGGTLPPSGASAWEITLYKRCVSDVIFGNPNAFTPLILNVNYGLSGYVSLTVPVSGGSFTGDGATSGFYYNFISGTKYWIKLGYGALTGAFDPSSPDVPGDGDGYYVKVSTDGVVYTDVLKILSEDKFVPDGVPFDIYVGGSYNFQGDALFLDQCSCVADGVTTFDGSRTGLVIGTDVTCNNYASALIDVINVN